MLQRAGEWKTRSRNFRRCVGEQADRFRRVLLLHHQDAAQSEASVGLLRLQFQDLARGCFSFRKTMEQNHHHRQIVIRGLQIRAQRNGLLKLGYRAIVFLQIDVGAAKVVVGLHEVGCNLRGFFQVLCGRGKVPRVEGLHRAIEFLGGFGGDAQFALVDGARRGNSRRHNGSIELKLQKAAG